DKTFLRGIQRTNEEGYVMFETIFPLKPLSTTNHYTSCTNHIHVIAHGDGSVSENGTFKASSDRHLFFDQSLISIVDATSPYITNSS
ncbi:uncharacterized protein BT62DRAFT_904759, partial [Guyanagaster necrorhizus]